MAVLRGKSTEARRDKNGSMRGDVLWFHLAVNRLEKKGTVRYRAKLELWR